MAGTNTTGKPRTKDYNLGRGKLYLATMDTTTGLPTEGGYRDLGNCPQFNVNVSEEEWKHFSSMQGLKQVDATATLQIELAGSFSLDELSDENQALFFNATQGTHANPATAAQVETEIIEDVVLGKWYDLRNIAGARYYDIDTAKFVFEKQGSPDVTLVENTDYELDLKMGRIFFLSTATNIVAGDAVDMTVTDDAGAVAVTEIKVFQQTEVRYVLKFIGKNAQDADKQSEFQFHQVKLKSNGDQGMISDDASQIAFNFSAEYNALADADSPVCTIRTHANS